MHKQKITIKKLSATWYVRADSKILGRSRNVLQLTEGVHKPVLYFPRDDLNMALFTKTGHSTHCPYKGDASYFTVSHGLENAAWSYETPIDDVLEIKDHIAFYTDRIQLEKH